MFSTENFFYGSEKFQGRDLILVLEVLNYEVLKSSDDLLLCNFARTERNSYKGYSGISLVYVPC